MEEYHVHIQPEKTGFSYLYTKRKVLENGIDTVPLEIVLTPWRNYDSYLINNDCVFSFDHEYNFDWDFINFFSLRQVYMFRLAMLLKNDDLVLRILAVKNSFCLRKIEIKDSSINLFTKIEIMRDILEWRVIKENFFKEELQRTGKRKILISGTDLFWEVGFLYRYALVLNPNEYIGRNQLGQLLEEIKDAM